MPRAASGPYTHPMADEIALVLAAEGIRATLEPTDGGLVIVIDDADARRAEDVLVDEYPDGVARSFETRAAAQARTRSVAPEPDQWFGPGSWVLFLLTA